MKTTILISGGTSGLGKTIAQILSPHQQVIILSPSEDKLKKVAAELNCDYEVCDITDYQQCERAIQNTLKKHQQIGCLINNAGIWIEGGLDQNDADHIQKTMDINATGVIFLSKAVIPTMKKQKQGFIINVISQAGLYAKAKRSVYDASKWAVTGLTKCLEQELAPYNIKVTGLYPGFMETPLFEKMGTHKDFTNALNPESVAKAIKFLIDMDHEVLIPELGIKKISNQ
ncbi:MAG: hypothetical protein COV55_01675 [Candidatus Komeilibacteria bacterium CG11_big_fil_rev_8_21_14_0_20_36_20]|uniref:Short-chain dehydrogenase n=1 Tax=Candidatus Komeilibacteria bacterium CG11_big_fil_rev_8_21_14_0_20_36_20 TaxID=1974477 RepID=A0A2H0NDZ3_9BACT|nr:MAG: hypothetical protein COV55_01675 [Candidatus Komeilibacteria bacterium CG11_big_fil_rev_8_21_14_0_20_36_20]PIR81252.1 MAG: hypothetical protein COU21_04660 [Candidatus Komeilibacteria bacterium CG10_big_fil_rev_8_21_14_0_10_36_65]PJC55216.1 MAG: hypothetical protein CO027_03600 [Candidatus Komeilibacteria bacterium CG_4_9_14_0_2_um_filter_36_13]